MNKFFCYEIDVNINHKPLYNYYPWKTNTAMTQFSGLMNKGNST